jgi:endoglucanase
MQNRILTFAPRLTILAALLATTLAAQPASYRGKPYEGKTQIIPGRIQAEPYDSGGEGVAYHDADAANNGSGKLNQGNTFVDRFRQDEGVDLSYTKKDIDKTLDGAQEKIGDLYLGWTAAGEWVNYTIDVQAAGTYRIQAHLSSRTEVAQIALAFDNVDKTGPITLPTTGHWHIWRNVENLAEVKLEKGIHVMTLSVVKEGNFNLDYLEFVPVAAANSATGLDAFEQTRQMRRGVNIIGYDPLWKDFSKARFQDRHFRLIKEAGFQSVRVNLAAFDHMDKQYQLEPQWLKTLDWAVKGALDNNLTILLDEHDFTYCGKDAEGCHDKLMAFWRQISERYKDAPPAVVFEILNEPNQKLTSELWNADLNEALAIIREKNPTRNVVIGPSFWNNIHTLAKLELPADDRHIIVTVHYYLPMEFTHQGAPWNKETAKLSGIAWGKDAEKQRMEQDFASVQTWSKAENRPILLGEFGAYDKADMDSRVEYTAHAARTAESLGWAWTYWQFDSDFIVWDMAKDAWVTPVLKALIP